MKKLTVIIALFTYTFGFSQAREKGTVEIIPTVGSTQSGTSLFTNDRSSIRLGILGDYYFNNRWSIRSGVELLGMGDSGFLFIQRDLELNYLNIPIHANWHFGSTRKWNLNFGLSPSFLTKAEENDVDVSNVIESFQLGFSYGIGYKLEITENFGFLFDVQAFAGLTNYGSTSGSDDQNIAASGSIGAVLKL